MINYPDGDESESSQKGQFLFKDAKPFPNLRRAGQELAEQLDRYRKHDRVIVLAVMTGGLLVADEVARNLAVPMDLLFIRRLLAPDGPGSASSAVSVAGTMIVDEDCVVRGPEPSTPFEYFIVDALADLRQRERICRRELPPVSLEGKTVILVDCGIRSASTMSAAIKAVRRTNPEKIVAAVPAASFGGSKAVAAIADEFSSLVQPKPFGNVAAWYKDFSRPTDEEVGQLLGA
jgi:putative phosphoribosyl transferase